MTDTPQLLLGHHLKALKLPTFLREYEKLARNALRRVFDHVRFLLRLVVRRAARSPRADALNAWPDALLREARDSGAPTGIVTSSK